MKPSEHEFGEASVAGLLLALSIFRVCELGAVDRVGCQILRAIL